MYRSLGPARAVAERCVSLRRRMVMFSGGITSANAGMSSDKKGENPFRRNPKGSCVMFVRAGLAGP